MNKEQKSYLEEAKRSDEAEDYESMARWVVKAFKSGLGVAFLADEMRLPKETVYELIRRKML